MSRFVEASLMFPLPQQTQKYRLCRFSNNHMHYLCVSVCGSTLPQHFKFGKVDGVPDKHCEIDGFD